MKVKLKRNDNQILLSIGMIVKNEEKHLENCMKALMPLRKQVKSELIIVDTGSTDRTIEIAKKYADKFYEFEWCNDFSAARNYGLERASGKWFMFLDADEYFDEDIIEIVNFFRSPKHYEKYNSASYIVRNYRDCEMKNYSEFYANRMVKLLPDVKFVGSVHEHLPSPTPHLMFDTFVHHFGYCSDVIERKVERNSQQLMEQYEENMNDPRVLAMLCDSHRGDEKEKYLKLWLELCRKGDVHEFYRNHCYVEYIKFLGSCERYDEAIELYNEYLKLDGIENSVCTVQIYATIATIYFLQKKYEKSYSIYEKYFDMYKRYHEGKLNIMAMRFSEVSFIQPYEYENCVICAADCLRNLNRTDEASKLLADVGLDNSVLDNADFEHVSLKNNIERCEMKVKINPNEKKNNGEILLSIGMIVKNEEKHLENCMKALLPLRQQIKSELIIVDTGSTDRSIEIAKKYADKFYEFEWCDDFAAARNYGLDRAVGKWFMFLDADEYFDEDISQIVNFFKYPELYEKYNSASYVIRNYSDLSKRNYNDFFGSRMVKRTPDVRFHDAIHEWLPMKTPHGYFDNFVHHFGYAYQSNKARKAKNKRNYDLMIEEYNNNPNDARIFSHLIGCCPPEDRKMYLDKWLEVSRNGKAGLYRNHCYSENIRYYISKKEYDKCKELYDEYIGLERVQESVVTVSVYSLMAMIYYQKEDYKKAYEFFEKYLAMYKQYKNSELDMRELNSGILHGLAISSYDEYTLSAAECLFKLDRDEEAVKLLSDIDINKIDFVLFSQYSLIISKLADNPSRHAYIADFYEKVIANGDRDRLSIINKLLEEFYANNPEKRLEFAKSMSKIKSDDAFVSIMKIAAKENDEDVAQDIKMLIDSIDDWKGGYSEIIYLAIKHKVDISSAVPKINYEQTRDFMKIIASNHDDYAEIILDYSQEFSFTGSIKQFFWLVSALETAALSPSELEESQKSDLYHLFISVLSDYVMNIYNPELFNADDAEIMPPLHRFGYYMGIAMIALNIGDKIGYIKNIKEALKNSEPMKDVVAFLLAEFEAGLK